MILSRKLVKRRADDLRSNRKSQVKSTGTTVTISRPTVREWSDTASKGNEETGVSESTEGESSFEVRYKL